jgi:hypothetical protein
LLLVAHFVSLRGAAPAIQAFGLALPRSILGKKKGRLYNCVLHRNPQKEGRFFPSLRARGRANYLQAI